MSATLLFSRMIGGPTQSTIQSCVRRNRRFIEFGISPKSIEAVAEYYKEVMYSKCIKPGSVLVGTAVDDTVITGGADYDVATGHVIGHCGINCAADERHQCTGAGWFIDRNDSDAYAKLVEAFSQHRVARCKMQSLLLSEIRFVLRSTLKLCLARAILQTYKQSFSFRFIAMCLHVLYSLARLATSTQLKIRWNGNISCIPC